MGTAQLGNCYVATEALWHLIGGKNSLWRPEYVHIPGGTHWYLRHSVWRSVFDPSHKQFASGYKIPYHQGVQCGFLTKRPSKRARELMERMLWKEPSSLSSKTTKRTSAPLRKWTGQSSR